MVLDVPPQDSVLANAGESEQLVGLTVEPGTMVIDPGAQIPLVGLPQLQTLDNHLRERGLCVKWVNRNTSQTGGVGGKAKILGEVEIPIGLAGVSGIMTMKVTDQDIPPLIAGEFLKKLKANIDYEEDKVTWKKLGPGRVSELTVLPSHHITCRVDQSSDGNWMDPRLATTFHRLNDKQYAESYSSDPNPQSLVAVDTLAQNQLGLTDYAVAPAAPNPPSANHDVVVITTRTSCWEPIPSNFCKLSSHRSLSELIAEANPQQSSRNSRTVVARDSHQVIDDDPLRCHQGSYYPSARSGPQERAAGRRERTPILPTEWSSTSSTATRRARRRQSSRGSSTGK